MAFAHPEGRGQTSLETSLTISKFMLIQGNFPYFHYNDKIWIWICKEKADLGSCKHKWTLMCDWMEWLKVCTKKSVHRPGISLIQIWQGPRFLLFYINLKIIMFRMGYCPQVRPRACWRDYKSQLDLEHLSLLALWTPQVVEKWCREKSVNE